MNTLIFGDPFFAERTRRSCGGFWVDLESHPLTVEDTLFVESGALIQPFSPWKVETAVRAVGATLEEADWTAYFANPNSKPMPRPRTFFLSAKAVSRLRDLRKTRSFWTAFDALKVRTWVDPQLRNWFHNKLRVLQVVTSLHVGGAERVCAELASMSECVGIATWGAPRRSEIRKPNWDLSPVKYSEKVSTLLTLAKKLHVDVIHTHLLTAEENERIAEQFPLVTTIHNSPEGWPIGYDKKRPGLLVACANSIAEALGKEARVAWNGVRMPVTSAPKQQPKKEIALVAVANFRSQKRLHRLPAILKALKQMGYAPTLKLVGEVHTTSVDAKRCYDLLISEAKKAGVRNLIKIIKTQDVRAVLARSNVFVSVSKYEGLSLAQLEALGAGLPIVATGVTSGSELREAVEPGAYVALPVNARARSFAEAVIKVSRLPRKDRLPKQFTADAMRKRYLWLYHSSLARGAKSNEMWLLTNNFSMGGAQTSAKRLLKRWSASGPVAAFTFQEERPTKGSLELMAAGIPVFNLPGQYAKDRAFELMRRCVISRPASIFFWNAMSHEKNLIADALAVDIVDVSPGEMYFNEMNRYLSNPYPELPVRRASDYGRLLHAAVVKYGRESDRMQEYLGITPHVIPNGVEGIEFTARDFEKEVVFGTAARIAPHKRLEDLVEAFSGLSCRLKIAGRIEQGAEMYADDLKKRSGDNIEWVGEQAITGFLPQIDIFAMISEPAGCPNASLEAMRSGLPLLITDVGGANEQAIPGFNGWLVPARDTEAMRAAIKELLALPPSTLRVMSKASLYHSKNFSMEKMISSYRELVASKETFAPVKPASRNAVIELSLSKDSALVKRAA